MRTFALPRLLLAGFTFAFLASGVLSVPAAAKNTSDWSQTTSRENVLIQSCVGFDITSSYTANIAYHLTTDNSGDEVLERMTVDFTGAFGNSVTGKSYAYDGKFMRRSDYVRNQVTINDLELRFEVGTPGEFAIAVDRMELDLVADPPAVVRTIVSSALQLNLCYLVGDSLGERGPAVLDLRDLLHPSAFGTANEIGSASDRMTSWTELDPCDTTPPGQSC